MWLPLETQAGGLARGAEVLSGAHPFLGSLSLRKLMGIAEALGGGTVRGTGRGSGFERSIYYLS